MSPPSVQLLRALKATEFIRTSFPRVCQTLQTPHPPSTLALCHHARFPRSYSSQIRIFPSTPIRGISSVPNPVDRGPASQETTQTDFGSLNVLGNSPPPTTAIDACLSDGFHLDNGLKIIGGRGCLLVGGEAFSWRPWLAGERARPSGKGRMMNKKGQWDVEKEAWGLLDLVWPKPGEALYPLCPRNLGRKKRVVATDRRDIDLLILGLGPSTHPISPETRRHINSLGIRVDVQDTRNAAAQFNLLATERGVGNIAAALIPIGWKEPRS